jgi:peptide deformylase
MSFLIVNGSVTAIEFKLLFTPTERVQAREAAKIDPVVADMFLLLDDPRTQEVSLAMPQIQAMLEYLVQKEILTEQRKGQILNAEIPSAEDSAISVLAEAVTE